MKDVIEMSGRLLLFDKVDKCGRLFSKNCKIIAPKTVPVILNFDTSESNNVIGSADIKPDEKGLICDVKLTNFDLNILHTEFKDQLYIGGFYTQVKMHKENDISVIDSALLRYIGTTIFPADDECKIVLKKENNNDQT